MICARWLVTTTVLFVLLACESATNLEVSYVDDAGSDAAPPDAAPEAGPDPPGKLLVLEGCPCDPASGHGCCVTATSAFCTNDYAICAGAKGEWLRCAKRDSTFESECCWAGTGAGATTRWAAACTDGTTACLTDVDCAGTGQSCKTATCAGFTFGQCAAAPPSCPVP
jgi:hypothetical protein